jgi:hypothetical protein
MSTRAQAHVRGTGVFMYQHYDGYNLFEDVCKSVLRAQKAGRMNDPEYMARMIFCDMVKDDVEGSTGFGLGPEVHGDIEYLVHVIPTDNNQSCQVLEKDINKNKWVRRFSVVSGKMHDLVTGEDSLFPIVTKTDKVFFTITGEKRYRDSMGRFTK